MLGRRIQRPLGCHAQVIQLPSNARGPSLGKLVLQLPLLAFHWQGGSLHKPWYSMPGCLTHRTEAYCLIPGVPVWLKNGRISELVDLTETSPG
jgi:hypothetical protein